MLEFSEVVMSPIAIHRVGSKSREEGTTISHELFEADEQLAKVLHRYFLKPFTNTDGSYKFTHVADLGENPMYQACTALFESPDRLKEQSVKIANHLYEQSEHPHIKPGEIFVTLLKDCILEGELGDAIGIFKAETREQFLKLKESEGDFDLWTEFGLNIKKLDKGALIFNTEKETGYRVFTVDNNNYDAQYWIEDFLNVETDQNEVFQTKAVLDLCHDFAQEVVAAESDTKERVMFMNKSMDYMKQHEAFDLEEFTQTVIEDAGMAKQFKQYKNEYEDRNELQPMGDFEISQPAVKSAKKHLKNQINLDTNIQIKLNFNDPESGDRFVVKGYDEEKEMYFYQIFFNREV